MDAFITALTTAIDADALWAVLAIMVPLIVIVTLFALGLNFARKGVKGVSKGKVRF